MNGFVSFNPTKVPCVDKFPRGRNRQKTGEMRQIFISFSQVFLLDVRVSFKPPLFIADALPSNLRGIDLKLSQEAKNELSSIPV